MKEFNCGDCAKFCTDYCKFREDVDSSTHGCPCYEAKDFCAECQIPFYEDEDGK